MLVVWLGLAAYEGGMACSIWLNWRALHLFLLDRGFMQHGL